MHRRPFLRLLTLLLILLEGMSIPQNTVQASHPPAVRERLQNEGWQTYASPAFGFVIAYPLGWTNRETIKNTPVQNIQTMLQQVEFADDHFTSVRVSTWARTNQQTTQNWWQTIGAAQYVSTGDISPIQQGFIDAAETLIVYPKPGVKAQWIIVVIAQGNFIHIFEFFAPFNATTVPLFHSMLESLTWSVAQTEDTTLPALLTTNDAGIPTIEGKSARQVTTCCGTSSPGNPFPCNSDNNNGNCTWWAFHKRTDIPCRGNADTWASCARGAGFVVDNNPQAGDVIVYPNSAGGYDMHVAYVEQVHSITATQIDYTMSQMAWGSNEQNNCRDNARNGTPWRATVSRSSRQFIHRKGSTATPPEGGIDNPAHNSTQSGTTQISGWTRVNGSSISRVEIWIDGALRGNAVYGDYRNEPSLRANVGYHWDWNTTQYTSGPHTIQAKAFAANGTNIVLSASGPNNTNTITVQNDTVAPTGTLTAPATNSATNNPALLITANASDTGSGVQLVDFYVRYDGAFKGVCRDTSAPYTCNWNAGSLADQQLIFTIHVHDNAGNFVIDPGGYRYVTLDRTPPTTQIETLSNVQTNNTFTVRWGGNDALTGITGYDVEYTDNGSGWIPWLGNTSRTNNTFSGIDTHTYRFRGRARDGAGNVGAYMVSNATTVQTAVTDSYENDNTSANAVLIYPFQEQQHNFHLGGDEDWVKFYVESNVPVSLRTTNLDLGVDTVLELYSPYMTQLWSSDDWHGYLASRLDLKTASSGYFYARVRQFGGQIGANTGYTLILGIGDSAEFNDGDYVTELNPSFSRTTHNAHVPGDEDFFLWGVTEAGPYTVMTTQLGQASDTYIQVQTSRGDTLTNDDAPGLGLASQLHYYADRGVEKIQIKQFQSSTYGPDTGYTLLVARGDTYEHDNVPTNAVVLPTDGVALAHNMHVPGDEDWHRLHFEAGNHYALTTALIGTDADVMLELYASDGLTLLTQAAMRSPWIGWDAHQNGDYYLRIRHQNPEVYSTNDVDTRYLVAATVDNAAPTGTITSAISTTNSLIVPLQLTTNDDGIGVAEMQFASYSATAGDWIYTDWMPYTSVFNYHLSDEAGSRTIWVLYRDYGGNYSEWVGATVLYDHQPPAVSIQVEPPTTDWNAVALQWSAEDTGSGITTLTLRWSTDGISWQETSIADLQQSGTLFFGQPGISYQFVLRATDSSGNIASSDVVSASFAACHNDASEPDGNSSVAHMQKAPASSTHTICKQGDEDWIMLATTAGTTYTFETQELQRADTRVTLYAPDATTVITTSDDWTLPDISLASRIVWQAPTNDTYYIKVSDANAAIAGDGVSYTLVLNSNIPLTSNQSYIYLPIISEGAISATTQRRASEGMHHPVSKTPVNTQIHELLVPLTTKLETIPSETFVTSSLVMPPPQHIQFPTDSPAPKGPHYLPAPSDKGPSPEQQVQAKK